jgi:hypothetical protein
MRYIKNYKEFDNVNEEFGFTGLLVGLGLSALLVWLGAKAFQILEMNEFRKKYVDSGNKETVKIKYTVEVPDFEKSKKETFISKIARKLGLKVKTEVVEEELEFNVLESKDDGGKFYSIKVKESEEEEKSFSTGEKRVVVFNKNQFEEFKSKAKEILKKNPLEVLGTHKGRGNLKTYTPLQFR